MNRLDLVAPVILRALRGAEDLPVSERADLYDGIAALLDASSDGFPSLAKEARSTAQGLRDAEGLQLHFRNLFTA